MTSRALKASRFNAMSRARFVKSKEIAGQVNAEKIGRVEDPLLKEILICRFQQKMKVPDISEKLHYSLRHTHRLINKAVQAAEERKD